VPSRPSAKALSLITALLRQPPSTTMPAKACLDIRYSSSVNRPASGPPGPPVGDRAASATKLAVKWPSLLDALDRAPRRTRLPRSGCLREALAQCCLLELAVAVRGIASMNSIRSGSCHFAKPPRCSRSSSGAASMRSRRTTAARAAHPISRREWRSPPSLRQHRGSSAGSRDQPGRSIRPLTSQDPRLDRRRACTPAR
jgi:hypothetical protein